MYEASSTTTVSRRDSPTELAYNALGANKLLQRSLNACAQRLETEIQEIDKLLSAAEGNESQDDDSDQEIQISGAKKATGPFPLLEYLNTDSPFYVEASRRSRYLSFISVHPMKGKELEALAEAVKSENRRLKACAVQSNQGSSDYVDIDIENNVEAIDWSVVAEKVSDVSKIKRSPDECRVRWVGDQHPQINHADWSASELDKLTELVAGQRANAGKVDWVDVADKLGTHRTPLDCMRRGVPRQHHYWTPDNDKKLLSAIDKYGIDNWQVVAQHVSEHATSVQCQWRYHRTLDPTLKKGPWSEEEDERLRKAVSVYGNAWMDIAATIPGRVNDQCRDRWSEHLNAGQKMPWAEELDKQLIYCVETLGNQWKAIGQKIGHGKTGQQCKSRYEKLKKQRVGSLPGARPQRHEIGAGAISRHKRKPRASKLVADMAAEPNEEEVSMGWSIPQSRPDTRRMETEGEVTGTVVEGATADDVESAIPGTGNPVTSSIPKPKPRPRAIGKKGKADTCGAEVQTPDLSLALVENPARIPGESSRATADTPNAVQSSVGVDVPTYEEIMPEQLTTKTPGKGRKRTAEAIGSIDIPVQSIKRRMMRKSGLGAGSNNAEIVADENLDGAAAVDAVEISASSTDTPSTNAETSAVPSRGRDRDRGGLRGRGCKSTLPRTSACTRQSLRLSERTRAQNEGKNLAPGISADKRMI